MEAFDATWVGLVHNVVNQASNQVVILMLNGKTDFFDNCIVFLTGRMS